MNYRRQDNSSRGRGRRHRNMYELTGLPGWVRFGSSPGFAGGGRGMGPCAEYIQRTGQMDDFIEDLKEQNPNISESYSWNPANRNDFSNTSKNNQREILINRIKVLERELQELKKELSRL
ncbi:MAG: hypothetical protein GF308_10560 [Candidatus Heimdallarchaeota archaeon]|nr:hypothetical protein [Candidatus Heimdallarchaeota archaeon]